MFKIKLAFLYVDEDGSSSWSHLWVEWDGESDTSDIIEEWKDKETATLKEADTNVTLKHVIIIESQICGEGKYYCNSCEQHFREPDNGYCPYCRGSHYTENCLLEEELPKICFNKCPKCGSADHDISWGKKEWFDNEAFQRATCKKCGCEFTEVYQYTNTEMGDRNV